MPQNINFAYQQVVSPSLRGGCWRLNPACTIHKRCWDKKLVVLNFLSGQTHILNEFSSTVLLLLEEGPLSSKELSEKIVDQFDYLVLDSEVQDYIDKMLSDMDTLGFIEPCIV